MRRQLLNTITHNNTNLAFCIQNKFYTYSELYNLILKITQKLDNENIEDQFVGLIGYDRIETYAAALALWFKGIAYVPISPNYPQDRSDEILEQASCNYILTAGANEKNFAKAKKIELDLLEGDLNSELSLKTIEEENIMCMLFTSGSTGTAKGVPYSLKNINTTLDSYWALDYDIDTEDNFLQMFELTFDMSLLSFLPALIAGATVYTVNHKGIKYLELLKVLTSHQITFANMVPSILIYLKPYFNELLFKEMKYSIFGGEPLYLNMIKLWRKVVPNAKIINISGPCETTMACMSYHVPDQDHILHHNNIIAFGKAWKNTRVIIINDKEEILGPGEIGELCFAGDNVMKGYFKLPVLNEKVFLNKIINGINTRFYKSGDLSYYDELGNYYSCGRKDFQYKVQGFKVELAEIESLVLENFETDICKAIVVKNELMINEIYLVFENIKIEKEKILNFLKQKLPYYSIPKKILLIDHFPRILSGKIDHKALEKLAVTLIKK